MEVIFIGLLLGICSAMIGSILGLGGGVIIVPALIYFSPYVCGHSVTIAQAVGTSLAVIVVTAVSSLVKFSKQGRVDIRSGWIFVIFSGPATMIGSLWTSRFPEGIFQLVFGVFLLMIVALIGWQRVANPLPMVWQRTHVFVDQQGIVHRYGYSLLFHVLIGCAVGLASGLFGIGGGALLVPMMILVYRYPIHVATATSMFVICISALLGTMVKISAHEVIWTSFAVIAPGALIGGWLGAWLTGKMTRKLLLFVFSSGITILALWMIAEGIMMRMVAS